MMVINQNTEFSSEDAASLRIRNRMSRIFNPNNSKDLSPINLLSISGEKGLFQQNHFGSEKIQERIENGKIKWSSEPKKKKSQVFLLTNTLKEVTNSLIFGIKAKIRGYDESANQKLKDADDIAQDMASHPNLLRRHTERQVIENVESELDTLDNTVKKNKIEEFYIILILS